MATADFYSIMGIRPDATDDDIKKAYRKLAMELHPDRTKNDKAKTERFKKVNEAYAILSDPEQRRRYDQLRKLGAGGGGVGGAWSTGMGAGGSPFSPFGGTTPEEFMKNFTAEASRMTGGAADRNLDDLSSLFETIFGGTTGARGNPHRTYGAKFPRQGGHITVPLRLTFAEAALGTRKKVGIPQMVGRERPLYVEIVVPAGVKSGSTLRMAGKGDLSTAMGKPGDLFLPITIEPHPRLKADGDDIVMELRLSVSEAALGTKIEVPTLDGPIMLSVPPGTSSGTSLRIGGRGMRTITGRGSQFCIIEIAIPDDAASNPKLKKLFEELRRLEDELRKLKESV